MGILWALARKTIIRALRMKTALVLIALFLLAAPFLLLKVGPSANPEVRSSQLLRIEADGTQPGEVKVLLTYNITVATGLLMFLTFFLSVFVLDSEIAGREIYLLATKPIRRWQIVVGKWLGIVILDAWLLLIMGAITVCLAWYFARLDRSRPEGYRAVREQILTSRRSVRPPEFDVDRIIADEKARLRAEGLSPKEIAGRGIEAMIKRNIEKKRIRIPPLGAFPVLLRGVPVAPDPLQTKYTIRYKLYTLQGTKLPVRCEWLVGRPDGQGVVMRRTVNRAGTVREFTVPAWVVDEAGQVVVVCRNLTLGDPRAPDEKFRKSYVLTFSVEEGLELLAPSGTFLGNFVRALLLILIRLAALGAVGIGASALLSSPVAALVVIAFASYALAADFATSYVEKKEKSRQTKAMASEQAAESGAATPAKAPKGWLAAAGEKVLETVTRAWHFLLWLCVKVVGSFSQTDPTEDLTSGRAILWLHLLRQFLLDILVRGGIALAFGAFVLERRQLGLPRT